MVKKVLIGFLVVVVLFLGYVATRNSTFRYENSEVIYASADMIFPYLSNFKLGGQWNPYELTDPNMKKAFTGEDGQVGSAMDFEGNTEAGSGRLEMKEIKPNEFVLIKLVMTKPMNAEQMVEYKLLPEGEGTRFTWTMYGDGGFMTKLMTVLVDCEAMFKGQMQKGFDNLKKVVETPATGTPNPPAAVEPAASPAQ